MDVVMTPFVADAFLSVPALVQRSLQHRGVTQERIHREETNVRVQVERPPRGVQVERAVAGQEAVMVVPRPGPAGELPARATVGSDGLPGGVPNRVVGSGALDIRTVAFQMMRLIGLDMPRRHDVASCGSSETSPLHSGRGEPEGARSTRGSYAGPHELIVGELVDRKVRNRVGAAGYDSEGTGRNDCGDRDGPGETNQMSYRWREQRTGEG